MKQPKQPKPRGINLHSLQVKAFLSGATQLRVPMKPQPPDAKSGQWGWIASSTDKKEVGTFRFSWIDDIGSSFTKRGREIYVSYKPPVQPGQIWFGREQFKNTIDDKSFVVVQYSDESIRLQLNDHGGEGDPIGTREHKNPMSLIGKRKGCKWRPSNQMPQWASRIVRKCVSVRVERLKNINGSICTDWLLSYQVATFKKFWNEIHGPESWDKNPWVWVIVSEVTG